MSSATPYLDSRPAAANSPHSGFQQAWSCGTIRSTISQNLEKKDILSLRLTSKALNELSLANAFEELTITLRPRTLDFVTRPARLRSLKIVGYNVKTLNFVVPKAARELDAVVINGQGEQQPYHPRVVTNADGFPEWDHGVPSEIMRNQRSPLWYAAGNIKAFITAFECLPNVEHIRIQCAPEERYAACFRTTVDRALTSIRIAIERAPLRHLEALTLNRIHLGGLRALHPLLGEAVDLDLAQRWRQISRLSINLDDFQDTLVPFEAWVMLHNYLWIFAPSLVTMSFRFANPTNLFPFAMETESTLLCKSTPANAQSLFQRIHFPNLQVLKVRNMRFRADQISKFLDVHCSTLRCIELDEVFARDSKIWQYAQAFGMTLEQWLSESTTVGQLEVIGRVMSAWKLQKPESRSEVNDTPTKQPRRPTFAPRKVTSQVTTKAIDMNRFSSDKNPHDHSSAVLHVATHLEPTTLQPPPSSKASQTTLCSDARSEVTLIGPTPLPLRLNFTSNTDQYSNMARNTRKPQPGLLFGEVASPLKSAVDAAVEDLASDLPFQPAPAPAHKKSTLLERAKSITNLVRLPSLRRRQRPVKVDVPHENQFACPETIRTAFQHLPKPAKVCGSKLAYKVTLRRAFSENGRQESLDGFVSEMNKEYLKKGHVACVPSVPLLVIKEEQEMQTPSSNIVTAEQKLGQPVPTRLDADSHEIRFRKVAAALREGHESPGFKITANALESPRQKFADVNRDSYPLGLVKYPVLQPAKSTLTAHVYGTPITQLINSFERPEVPTFPVETIPSPSSPSVKQPGQLRRIKSSRCLSSLASTSTLRASLNTPELDRSMTTAHSNLEPLPAMAYDPFKSEELNSSRMTTKDLKKLSMASSVWSLRSDEAVVPIMYTPEQELSSTSFHSDLLHDTVFTNEISTPTTQKRLSGLSTASSLTLPSINQAITPDEAIYTSRETTLPNFDTYTAAPPALSIRRNAIAKLTAATFDRREALLDRVQRLKRLTVMMPMDFSRLSMSLLEEKEFEEIMREMELRAPAPSPEKMELRAYF